VIVIVERKSAKIEKTQNEECVAVVMPSMIGKNYKQVTKEVKELLGRQGLTVVGA
jgi:diphthamide synthase subunit DPH2